MDSDLSRIKKIAEKWYIETRTGFEGPFDSKQEAEKFQFLNKCTDAARVEFAGLALV